MASYNLRTVLKMMGKNILNWVKSNCVNNLLSTATNLPLAAAQGKVLDEKIGQINQSYVGKYTLSSTWCVGRYGWSLLFVQNPIPKGLYSNYTIKFVNATLGYQSKENDVLTSDAVAFEVTSDQIGCRSSKLYSKISDYPHEGTITFIISKK